ncbi:DUF5710 domain-containing protein [Methylotenera sp.]|uniref:DUF5710 domain-containing protein n=1 Tax=Methylotenera sp. TaxID=2051956 RepID=UPI00272779C6|nr:DUF5710 domain-containing protein [Methylotenera sp.]MDO9204419.1 DUF5710 domain-containing protein [Methylotenera sp.]MDO9394044.1 DUF5710 domain-containing protein [Methylotenera sp.]MDP1521976.1 DUF5710 domain-containing protein [Methylotenera sp.]MDP2072196.1 DUF5710 domain-containing protein [Methylotenera sp.]MDP2230959.1 DUF5710 domain-containing protein [Methylotenera sp.]
MTTPIINLKVPFNEKDQAKALGARWNAEIKQWYVPQGVESAPFEKWFTNVPHTTTDAKTTSKAATKLTAHNQPVDHDIDEVNAKLREAYEIRDVDEW